MKDGSETKLDSLTTGTETRKKSVEDFNVVLDQWYRFFIVFHEEKI